MFLRILCISGFCCFNIELLTFLSLSVNLPLPGNGRFGGNKKNNNNNSIFPQQNFSECLQTPLNSKGNVKLLKCEATLVFSFFTQNGANCLLVFRSLINYFVVIKLLFFYCLPLSFAILNQLPHVFRA